MASVFTKIINGDIPCYKIAETEDCFAFLDIRPMAEGHTLCVPKQETDYIFDLEEKLLSKLTVFAKRVAKALEQETECMRVGMLVVGTEVPHAHIHLIPFQNEGQMNLRSKPVKMSKEELTDLAKRVAAHL